MRWLGAVEMLAFAAVFLPRAWMEAIHAGIGLGAMPEGPLFDSVMRQGAFTYGVLGLALWTIAADVVRHRSLVILTAASYLLGGSSPRSIAGRQKLVRECMVEQSAEWYALVTCLIVGLSHLLQRQAWADVFAMLHRIGKPGAFANGALSLLPGAVFVAAHPVWSGPAVVLTLFGWMLVFKGAFCFLAPSLALRGMAKAGAGNGRAFAAGGLLLLALAGTAAYALWAH